jgi:hypothetical protein
MVSNINYFTARCKYSIVICCSSSSKPHSYATHYYKVKYKYIYIYIYIYIIGIRTAIKWTGTTCNAYLDYIDKINEEQALFMRSISSSPAPFISSFALVVRTLRLILNQLFPLPLKPRKL